MRLRLSLIYGSMFIASGAALLAITYILVAHSQTSQGEFSEPSPAGGARLRDSGSTLLRGAFSQHTADLHALVIRSAIALAIMAVVSMWLGWLIAGRVLRPLRTITSTARDISATNLHERLALNGPDDEVKELGDTFDALLGRLEASFQSQRQFVANASHELRTPLARLKTLAQLALADPDASQRSLRFAHERVLASEQQLETLIDSLLDLASGEQALDRVEPLDLATLTREALRSRAEEIAQNEIHLNATLDRARAQGNRQLLERLVANLIDNAIRHNTRPGQIDVTTNTTAGRAILSISNSGPLIPETELQRLQQPFQRLAIDRTGHGEGFGLGLSIVHAIATTHHASIATQTQPNGGLRIDVFFPSEPQTANHSATTLTTPPARDRETRSPLSPKGKHPQGSAKPSQRQIPGN